jgi:hypothetical protein
MINDLSVLVQNLVATLSMGPVFVLQIFHHTLCMGKRNTQSEFHLTCNSPVTLCFTLTDVPNIHHVMDLKCERPAV